LVVTDYDGTLTQIQSLPQLATPAPVVTQLLATLARDTRNTVYVMSGRERRFMDKWLGKLKVGLAAEFGYCHRAPDDEQGVWKSLGRELDTSWKDVVRPIMQYFAERTPGTYIESKESSLAWHYRDADPHFGAWQAKDMQIHMEDVMSNLPLEIIQGNRLVEVRAGQESEIPNFKGSSLGRFPLVSADFWTSDHLSERSRSVGAVSGTRARGTLTLKRR
jgi:trehalose 6-phosphate synthase/phosphatase